MLDKEEMKNSEEVENTEKVLEREEDKEVDKVDDFVEDEKTLENTKEEANDSIDEDKKEETVEQDLLKDKLSFLQYFKEGIKNTLGIFIVSIGGLAVVGLILRYIVGLYVKDAWAMLFIVYLVISLFYPYIKSKYHKKNK
ncbi:DNA-binding protein [Clostridium sporogenes]|uniref:DNA-binding protein n=1 Tax=Clostridium botulinum TaxID=1491 RepID=A0A6M0T390_CLOBO|nr:DNA-binding protein [Clostridium sporogenes]NFA61595.1 DNA-binding protein [Clostridium botulinum]NFI73835.1 DNA-binding protein [Clostridium sporogenes]NFL71647.1 DNA-binding protein [Clostridium sporogenes]NFM24159.1 DNA-binding protein [Clostridium sporogenes]NFP61709.1 DNA-binding protein [Clostridium sporogenes]